MTDCGSEAMVFPFKDHSTLLFLNSDTNLRKPFKQSKNCFLSCNRILSSLFILLLGKKHKLARKISLIPSFTDGSTAVEFALIATPFLMLFGVIIESGFVTLSQQTLDLALERSSRQLRTGAFQNAADGGDPRSRFRQTLCGGGFILFSCGDVRVEVASASGTNMPTVSNPFDKATKNWTAGFGTRFDCPKGSEVVIVRAAVPVPRLFWFLDFTGRTMLDGRQILIANQIFEAEAYDQKSCA